MKRMLPTLLALALALTSAEAAPAAGVQAELKALPRPAAPVGPYRRAELTLRNDLAVPLAAVAVRNADGGPWLLLPATAAPRGVARLTVDLPADGPNHSYSVRVYNRYVARQADGPADLLAETQATIAWPLDEPPAEPVLAPRAFTAFETAEPLWPVEFRQQLLLVLAGVCVVCGFALVTRRRPLRALAAVTLAAAATALLWWLLRQTAPPTSEVNAFELVHRRADGPTWLDSVFVLTGRRTARGRLAADKAPAGQLWCVYPDALSMRSDETLLRPAEPAHAGGEPAEVDLAAGQRKMLRARRDLTANSAGVALPPRIEVNLHADGGWTVRADRSTPRALLIVGSRFFVVEAMAANAPRALPAESSTLLANLWVQPRELGFDDKTRRLLDWWLATANRGDGAFLVYPDAKADRPRLYVSAATAGLQQR